MKHAGARALDALEDLLAQVRACSGVQERTRGVFYRRAAAFLHFHEDPIGLFADLRAAEDWERFPVDTAAQRRRLLGRLRAAIRESDQRSARSAPWATTARGSRRR